MVSLEINPKRACLAKDTLMFYSELIFCNFTLVNIAVRILNF